MDICNHMATITVRRYYHWVARKMGLTWYFNLQMSRAQGYWLLHLNCENMQIYLNTLDLKQFLFILTPKPNSADAILNNEF